MGLLSGFAKTLSGNIGTIFPQIGLAQGILGQFGGFFGGGGGGAPVGPDARDRAALAQAQGQRTGAISRRVNQPFGTAAGAPPPIGTGDPFFTRAAVVSPPQPFGGFGAPVPFAAAQLFAGFQQQFPDLVGRFDSLMAFFTQAAQPAQTAFPQQFAPRFPQQFPQQFAPQFQPQPFGQAFSAPFQTLSRRVSQGGPGGQFLTQRPAPGGFGGGGGFGDIFSGFGDFLGGGGFLGSLF